LRVLALVASTLATFGAGAQGCGYSTTSRTAKDIKSIHIPFFENTTPEPNLEITVTESIIQFLIDDNTLKVTGEDGADAVLEGKVVGFDNRPFSFNLDLNAEEYRVEVRVEASLFSRRSNTFIWQKRAFRGDGSYFVDRVEGGNTFDDAVAESIEEITDLILNLTTQDW
jgi:hypothetical protein